MTAMGVPALRVRSCPATARRGARRSSRARAARKKVHPARRKNYRLAWPTALRHPGPAARRRQGRIDRMGQLDGKVALITGASKGIGRVMSQLFAQEGASVICAARSRDLVEETAGLVKAAGGRALAVIGDAAAEGDVQNMVERGVRAFGRLDVLVNNAGDGGPTKRVQDYTTEDWFYTINSCLTDRKSTRLNSSHVEISYAVFCLKKKTKKI